MGDETHRPWEPEGKLVTLETPEQIGLERRIAPLGTRIAAVILDSLIIYGFTAVLLVGFVVVGMVLLRIGFTSTTDTFLEAFHYWVAVITLASFILWTFYFTYCEVRMEGQTYGKKALGIRTIVASGQGITLSGSLIRNLARVVDHNPVLLIIPALDPQNRRMGDFLAGTLVVHAPRKGQSLPPIATRNTLDPSERRFFFSAQVGEKLVPDDLNLLEHFFRRLPTVTSRIQRNILVADMGRRYQKRLEMDPDKIKQFPREFLQELYQHLREKYDSPLL